MTPSQDHQINLLAGDLSHILLYGDDEARESLLQAIEQSAGLDERLRIQQWVAENR